MSYPFEMDVRRDIVKAARLMHMRGLIGGHDGNISARVATDKIICTPSGVNKGFIDERNLVAIDMDGKVLRGTRQPSSEVKMHLAAYHARDNIRSIVHAHPPHCVACTLVGISLMTPVVPEAAFLMGAVPTAPYSTPGTDEVPDSIKPYIADSEAILLARHGSVTFGGSVTEAYDRLEALEHIAQVLFLAHNLGRVQPLSPEELVRLQESVTSRGLPWRYPTSGPATADIAETIVQRVLEELRKGT